MANNEKARFFAMYLFQNVLSHDEYYEQNAINSPEMMDRINDGYYLLLKPLASISDEDAIKVAKLLQIFPEDVLDWLTGDYLHEDFNSAFQFLSTIDFLRSKGYALPYLQYSVEQLVSMNWIKLTD